MLSNCVSNVAQNFWFRCTTTYCEILEKDSTPLSCYSASRSTYWHLIHLTTVLSCHHCMLSETRAILWLEKEADWNSLTGYHYTWQQRNRVTWQVRTRKIRPTVYIRFSDWDQKEFSKLCQTLLHVVSLIFQ